MMRSGLALFDFDGTISDRDSFLLFVRHWAGPVRFPVRMAALAPQVARFLLGRYPNQRLKEDVLTRFFRGVAEEEFRQQAARFARERIPAILRPAALERLAWHRHKGHRLLVVSATPALILAPWCAEMDLELVATELEVSQGRLTGRIQGANCRGAAKVERIRALLDPDRFDDIYAYGDSDGDREMLALADHAFYRPFREERR